MNKLIMAAVIAVVLGCAGMAQAGCDANEAQQKALQFSQILQEKGQKDPQGYAQAMQELQPELLKIQQSQDLDALCIFYDKAIERLK